MRFGLIGVGNIGRIRARAIQRAAGCRLAAIADLDLGRARSAAPSKDIAIFDDYRRFLDLDAVDAVMVCTPPPYHEEVTINALEAGKHVLCEKPLSNSVDAARNMVEASRRTGKVLANGFNFRYIPSVQFLKRTIESGLIGDLDHVRGFAGHVGLAEFKASWEYDQKVVGGGALMDIGIHMIDLVRYILGEITEVYGSATSHVWKLNGSEDNGFALFEDARGRTGTLHATWTEWNGYRFQVEAYGTLGMVGASYGPMTNTVVFMDQTGGRAKRKSSRYPVAAVQEKLRGWQWSIERSFRQELTDFVKLCRGEEGAIADGFAGFRAVEIANAVYRSAREKRPVQLIEAF